MKKKWLDSLLLWCFVAVVGVFIYQDYDNIAQPFSIQRHGYLFLIGCCLSLVGIARSLYAKEVFNRLMVALDIFCLMGAIAFLGNISFMVDYYNTYTLLIFWSCFVGVGFITTFCTRAGFIGVLAADKKDVDIASLKLLLVTISFALYSLLFNKYYSQDTVLGYFFPISLLDMFYHKWGRQLRGEEKKSDWTFKW